MFVYLSDYVGAGTRRDPRLPRGVAVDQQWSALDLRGDKPNGGCFLASPVELTAGGLDFLGETQTSVVPQGKLNRIAQVLGKMPSSNVLGSVIGELMIAPVDWNPVKPSPSKQRYEIYLGGELFYEEAVKVPSSLGIDPFDNFNRADEAALADPWVFHPSGVNGVSLTSNAIQGTIGPGDRLIYHRLACVTANQFSQATAVTHPPGADWAVAVRVASGGGFTGYMASPWAGGAAINKWLTGGFATVQTVTCGNSNGSVYRLEIEGSTLRMYENGSLVTNGTATDTSLTSAGGGPGFFIYEAGGALDDWSGGDINYAGEDVSYSDHPRYLPAGRRTV